MNQAASICGDFVVAGGPGAAAWLRGLHGFECRSEDGDAITVATRGSVHAGATASGVRWLALADLVNDVPDAAADDPASLRNWRGRFAHLAWTGDGRVLATTDHFGSLPLYWYRRNGHFAVASDLRLLLGAPAVRNDVDLTAVYHYLNFAFIPAPSTICRDIRKVEPGTRLTLDVASDSTVRNYRPAYAADLGGDDHTLAAALRERITDTVHDFRPHGEGDWGCFLSGGTDSSSIVTLLARQANQQVHTCSIGFHEAGYDELDFARSASEACGSRPHLAYVDRARALGLLDTVIEAYDQPFGNTSAIPTLACAELGRSAGFSVILGGDGGDEIFGGNQRYAKDKVLDAFYRLPGPMKAGARAMGSVAGRSRSHLLNRVSNFTRRGSQPNPDRFYSDDSFASDYYGELLTPAFREQVAQDASLEFMRGVYGDDEGDEQLHRIMRLDLMMAIAQNDLVKVHGACKHHGVSARFPYLDPVLVEYCGRLPARYKVRGLNKRHLFKKAMTGILPETILRKRKQGFGLPTAVWLRDDRGTQELMLDVLLDERTRQRGWIEPTFVGRLLERHMAGTWDYSGPIWQLLVLELWMRRYMDGR